MICGNQFVTISYLSSLVSVISNILDIESILLIVIEKNEILSFWNPYMQILSWLRTLRLKVQNTVFYMRKSLLLVM